jgi:hypothetical protein
LTKDQKAAFDWRNSVVLGISLECQQVDAAEMRTQRYITSMASPFKYSHMWLVDGAGGSKPRAGYDTQLVFNTQTQLRETRTFNVCVIFAKLEVNGSKVDEVEVHD